MTIGDEEYAQSIPPPRVFALFPEIVLFLIIGDEL
jgi:hypothetical protein